MPRCGRACAPSKPVPVLANQWALHSTHTAAQLKDILKDFLHEGDRIVVDRSRRRTRQPAGAL